MIAIVWMGPVSTSNLAGVPLPKGWGIWTIGDVVRPPDRDPAEGIKPQDFRDWAAAKLGARPFDRLLELGQVDAVVLASFSAGHGLLELLLAAAHGDKRILGTLAADSYYGLELKPGYLAHGRDCVASGDPFWLTSSDAGRGPSSSSASQSLAPFAAELELRSARAPREMPPPVRTLGRGGVLWLDYARPGDGAPAHLRQAVELAPAALTAWVGGIGAGAKRDSSALGAVAFAAALAWGLS